jgi:hypothetical protein
MSLRTLLAAARSIALRRPLLAADQRNGARNGRSRSRAKRLILTNHEIVAG